MESFLKQDVHSKSMRISKALDVEMWTEVTESESNSDGM